MHSTLVISFDKISSTDVAYVGGKNASLGEMIKNLQPLGINIPDGFATTADAFRFFLSENKLNAPLNSLIGSLDKKDFSNLNTVSKEAKKLFLSAKIPLSLREEIIKQYQALCQKHGRQLDVAVRSSATAEDLPTASFAGQHDSFLNIKERFFSCRKSINQAIEGKVGQADSAKLGQNFDQGLPGVLSFSPVI